MKFINLFIVGIVYFTVFTGCQTKGTNNRAFPENDTLSLRYLDTFLVGEQIFPTTKESVDFDDQLKNRILLSFKSGNYYYYFYKEKEINFLSSIYWDQQVTSYVNQCDNGQLENSKLSRVNYTDGPFLTGLYNLKDSIVVITSDLRKKSKTIGVSYFSTRDSIFTLNNGLRVPLNLTELRNILDISNSFNSKPKFKIVLMIANSLVDNAWYMTRSDSFSQFSNVIVLSIEDKKLKQIEYLDTEFIDIVFLKNSIFTRDIHLH